MISDDLSLAQYRRTVAEHYQALRANNVNLAAAAETFRAARDRLFHEHPLSALEPQQRVGFQGLRYAPYDPAWRFVVPVETDVEPEVFSAEVSEGIVYYRRFGRVRFSSPDGQQAALSLFWIMGYGGGVFLSFRDQTNGKSSYGGGRYLIDTIKGADLGIESDHMVLDFNFAYHPSCFYSSRWICPLAPPENHLLFPVPVGELSRAKP